MAYLMLLWLLLAPGCQSQKGREVEKLNKELLELKRAIDDIKPGLGEIMGNVQKHHERLYFAALHKNWALAKYDLDEIKESLEFAVKTNNRIEKIETPLSELVGIIKPSLVDIEKAVKENDLTKFLLEYGHVTQSCNRCHHATDHGFIEIQTPTRTAFSNQKF